MDNCIYLDNSATTKPCKEAVAAALNSLEKDWGNPSSAHNLGVNAFLCLNDSRKVIAKSISAKPDEIIFTSGGTEANNLALIGTALSLRKQGNKIISFSLEHPSVLKALDKLKEFGFEIVLLEPEVNGTLSPSAVENAVDQNTILVSVMMVNNEIGSINNIKEIGKAIKRGNPKTVFHTDAAQAYAKLPIKVSELGVDLLSASGHKIHAPKGIGFLYKRKGINITPILNGGGQEDGIRSGTESIPLISALSAAVKSLPDTSEALEKMNILCSYAKNRLAENKNVVFNSPDNALPYILNISLKGYKSEPVLNALSLKNIFVSKGSACAKGHRSYVLTALHLSDSLIDSSVRISFSRFNTTEDVDRLVEAINEITKKLRRFC